MALKISLSLSILLQLKEYFICSNICRLKHRKKAPPKVSKFEPFVWSSTHLIYDIAKGTQRRHVLLTPGEILGVFFFAVTKKLRYLHTLDTIHLVPVGFVFLAASGVAKYTMEIVGNVGQNREKGRKKIDPRFDYGYLP